MTITFKMLATITIAILTQALHNSTPLLVAHIRFVYRCKQTFKFLVTLMLVALLQLFLLRLMLSVTFT